MNYQTKARGGSYNIPDGVIHLSPDGLKTICGKVIENTLSSKWVGTDDDITCKHCINKCGSE